MLIHQILYVCATVLIFIIHIHMNVPIGTKGFSFIFRTNLALVVSGGGGGIQEKSSLLVVASDNWLIPLFFTSGIY